MKSTISIFVLLFSFQSLASPASIKNKDGSFKVSDKSLNVMKITFRTLQGTGPWQLPKEALVKLKFTQGVYRRYQGNITLVFVTTLKAGANNMMVKSDDLEAGDEVAVTGTNFLRLTEADLNSETVDNCAH